MGKYIIDVDESEIIECWNKQAAKEIGYQEYALKQCPKIKVKPYSPTGDLISREALKKIIEQDQIQWNRNTENDIGRWEQCERILSFIDNAPTVDIKDIYQEGYYDGHLEGYTKAINEKRPQGEWKTVKGIDGDEYYECSNCGEPWVLMAGTPKDNNMNFCPNCGADMRGYEVGKAEGIMKASTRPQGEWIIDGHHRRCEKCGEYFCIADSEGNEIPSNFCPNCGADMRKGGAE